MSQPNAVVRKSLPNAGVVLFLGILSILFSALLGAPGLLTGIITLVLSRSGKRLRKETPDAFTGGSWTCIVTGRVLAVIGIVLSLLVMAVIAFAVFVLEIEWQSITF